MKEELRKFASEWLGTPFKHHGRDKKGIDCLGLVIRYFIDFHSWNVGDIEYAPLWPNHRTTLINNFYKYVDKSEKEMGVIALISLRPNIPPTHLGIVLDSNRCLHVVRGAGVVISNLKDLTVKGYYKLKDEYQK